jgi:dephospho-CoA kinase
LPGPSLIGLTGGVAAGKSEVLRILGELGTETLSTDEVVHELLAGDELREPFAGRWGEAVLAEGGGLDRAAIAAIVFGRPEELAWLESMLHPPVSERVQDWRRGLPDDLAVAVVEVPLLFESGMDAVFDATICVVADDEVRELRATERGTGELEGRTGRQLSQEEKAERATHVVHNDGDLEQLRSQVVELYGELRERRG